MVRNAEIFCSDIQGVAVAGVEGEPVTLTEPVTEAIAAGFAEWLLEKKKADASRPLRVSIGHDSRISAQMLKDAVSRGIAGADLDVVQYGHLPYNRNGFKFFANAGGLGKADIKEILEHESLTKSKRQASESAKKVDYMKVYTSDLVTVVCKAAGSIALGAITSGSQFLEPDGLFPNHIPNPEDKAAMKAFTQAVLQNKADLGIIFDTDLFITFGYLFFYFKYVIICFGSAAVDSTGREFNRNRLIALMSAVVLDEHPGTTIVTDSVTSDGLTTFIEKKLGTGKAPLFKKGYRNVTDEAIRLESHIAIETSGHGVKLLNKLASARASGVGGGSKVLNNLIEGLQEPAVAVELRLKINQNHPDLKGGSFQEYGEAVLKYLETSVDLDPKLQKAPVNYEGVTNIIIFSPLFLVKWVRVSGYGGWFLFRLSLRDPVLPLNIEAPTDEDAVELGLSVASAVKEFDAMMHLPWTNLSNHFKYNPVRFRHG
ncbi:hypothetical protein P3X46_025384 [Hevea brasiliensis]|uniref:Alpha-D-phosphohexomutase alpha/beta/alpha domain-containing protein n=1 Tax=Hevea brasiliensis TaxID=3981 RepID=A0ABQ9L5D4_HEVBR|nr:hypothetical protein P3X46_025384 [Hevea brasiliensis]